MPMAYSSTCVARDHQGLLDNRFTRPAVRSCNGEEIFSEEKQTSMELLRRTSPRLGFTPLRSRFPRFAPALERKFFSEEKQNSTEVPTVSLRCMVTEGTSFP